LKSYCASIAFPAWILGHNASTQTICASYGQDLAGTLASNCRTLDVKCLVSESFPTKITRLNDIRDGCIIIIMQRLHEDDLVGHVLESSEWKILRAFDPEMCEKGRTFGHNKTLIVVAISAPLLGQDRLETVSRRALSGLWVRRPKQQV
jgi:hypothetical protein